MTQQQHHEQALIERDADETIVVFRKWKEDGSIIALFPGIDEGGYRCSSYMRIGQHGAADYEHVVLGSVPAEEHEYEDLAEELTDLGYNLRILRKKPINL